MGINSALKACAGLNGEELSSTAGVEGCIFVHAGRFIHLTCCVMCACCLSRTFVRHDVFVCASYSSRFFICCCLTFLFFNCVDYSCYCENAVENHTVVLCFG